VLKEAIQIIIRLHRHIPVTALYSSHGSISPKLNQFQSTVVYWPNTKKHNEISHWTEREDQEMSLRWI
jgi:hypothetical protein